MIKKIGKQPLKANVHDLGSFMYKNSGSLDKINELIYGIGNYINAYDVQKHMNNSLAGLLGVGYDYNIHPVVFSPTVGKGIQYMKPEGYVEEGAEENQKSIYDEAKQNALGNANTTTQPTITPLQMAFATLGFGAPYMYNPHRAEKSLGGPIYDVGGALNAGAGALKLGTDALNNWGSKSQIKGMQGIYQGIGGLANTRFAGSNENLLEQDLATLHYNPGTYRDLMTTSSGFGVGDGLQAIGATMEGVKAGSGLGLPGMIGMGLFGGLSNILTTFSAKRKLKKRARREIAIANALGRAANAARNENFEDAAEGNDKGQGWNALFNYGSMNAGLGTSYQGALGGRLFDEGGFMGNHGTVWDTGLNFFNTGGSHEENPNGGILLGYDSQGTPNLVEEGEYKWTDNKYGFGSYIFSNRLTIPQEVANKYKLGGTAKKDVTFAKGIQKYLKDNGVEDMENDPTQQDTTGEFLATMATILEQVRIQEQIRQFIEELKKMPPEQQRQALEQLQQLAIQQQLQAMQEQLAMQLVEQQQQAMQQPMEQGQELMPQEVPQEAPQEQMVLDAGQPMMEQQGQAQVAPQAYGGRIFATGGNTMMENQGYEKLTDEDKEAIENQKRQQMQEDATRVQRQEEESEEERLDDQIDQIIEYAKETYNKELLVGARKAQRGNIEEKKAFIDRANQIMETERQQQQQTAAQQDQQQNAEMQARLQQEAQQPLPGEVPQEDMGINAMAYGGRMNTFAQGGSPDLDDDSPTTTETIESQKEPVRTKKEAQRLLLHAYGRRGYNELTEKQKETLMDYVMHTEDDLTNSTADQYDRKLGREIIDPKNLFADAPKVTMYDALEDENARKAFNESLDGYVAPGTMEWLAKEFKDLNELTDFYRSTLWDWWNKYNGRTDAGKWPGRDDESDLSKQFAKFAFDYKTVMDFYNSLDSNDPKQARLKDLISKQWIDKSTGKLADWTGENPWEYLNRYTKNDPRWTREGTVYENPAYTAWVKQEPVGSNAIQGRRIDTKHGEDHYPSGNAPSGGVEIQYYLNDINNADNRLGIDPTQYIYSNYYTVDANPTRVTSDDGSLEIWKYLVTPKATKNYVKVTYDKKGNPVYRRGTQEEMQSDGYVPYNDVPDNYKKVSNPNLPGYQMENVFYTPKLGLKGSNGKIMEGIEDVLSNIPWKELPLFIYQMTHPANQSYYNMALRQWDRVPMMATNHLGNYVAPQYVDINSMNNKAMALGLQGIQAALNISNGNVGSLNYNTQLANYMMQQGLADNLIKGTQWNAEQQQKAAAHNTEKVDTPNIANDLAVAKQNQDAMIARAQAYPAVADKMTENEASWHQGIALGIGRIANGNGLLLSNNEYRKIINALIQDLGLA